jgi:hypothetical protein
MRAWLLRRRFRKMETWGRRSFANWGIDRLGSTLPIDTLRGYQR